MVHFEILIGDILKIYGFSLVPLRTAYDITLNGEDGDILTVPGP